MTFGLWWLVPTACDPAFITLWSQLSSPGFPWVSNPAPPTYSPSQGSYDMLHACMFKSHLSDGIFAIAILLCHLREAELMLTACDPGRSFCCVSWHFKLALWTQLLTIMEMFVQTWFSGSQQNLQNAKIKVSWFNGLSFHAGMRSCWGPQTCRIQVAFAKTHNPSGFKILNPSCLNTKKLGGIVNNFLS